MIFAFPSCIIWISSPLIWIRLCRSTIQRLQIRSTNTRRLVGEGEKYYIQKIKPFYVNRRRYFEVTFTTAKDRENKAGRIIAFTRLPVISNYASRFFFQNESIEILGKTMPILLITGWEVSMRGCEFKNFYSVITGSKRDVPYGEQRTVCRYITENRFTLTEIMDFPEAGISKTHQFMAC